MILLCFNWDVYKGKIFSSGFKYLIKDVNYGD